MQIGPGSAARSSLVVTFALAILALTFVWRMPFAPLEWGFIRCDNDSLFHLHQVERTLKSYPEVPAFDSFAHYPRGFRVHWLAPHTFFYATIARFAGLDDLERVGRALSFVPPLLSLVGMVLLILMARAYSESWLVTGLAALLGAFSGEMVRPFFFGTIDHHLFAHLGVAAAVLGRLQRRLWLWLIGLLLLCAMTPEAILYVSVLLAALMVAESMAIDDDSAGGALGGIWFIASGVAGLLAWIADRVLQVQPLPLSDWAWTQPTLFQPAWYAVLGVAGWAGLAYVRRRPASGRAGSMLIAFLIVALTAALFLLATDSLGPISLRLAGAGRLYVGEEISVFHRGFFAAHRWYQMLAVASLYAVYRVWRAWRWQESSAACFGWLMIVAGFALGLREMRHLYVLAPLELIGFSVAAVAVGDLIALAAPQTARVAVAGMVAVALALPLLLSADVVDRSANRAEACASLPMIEEATSWLRASSPSPGAEDVDPPRYGVFAPWTLGHQIHVLARRPVIIDPFNHTDPDAGDWVGNVVEAEWLEQSDTELIASLQKLGVRYLVLSNPAEEIVSALRRKREAVDDVYRFEPDGRLTLLPGLGRYAAFRLFMAGGSGKSIEGAVLRYASLTTEHYETRNAEGEAGSTDVPRLQIYELTDSFGATSSAKS